MSLIIKKNTTFKIPRTPPISFLGLALWLKADAGVSFFSFGYISRLVLSGAVSGTFDAASVPTYFFDESRPNDYDLESGASTISWTNFEGNSFSIVTASIVLYGNTTYAGYFSTDGNIWQTFGNWTTPPSISGLTNDYSSGNGQYAFTEANPYDNNKVLDAGGGIFYSIIGSSGAWQLWYSNNEIPESFQIASNSNDLPNGTWTMLVEGAGTASSTGSAYATNPTPPTTVSSITSTVTTDNVAGWTDQSGNGNNAVGADTLPTLQSNAINGYPAIRFNNIGSDTSKFVISSSFNLKNSSAFVVVKQLNLDNEYARFLSFLSLNDLDYNADDGLCALFNNGVPQLQITSNANDCSIENGTANNAFALISYKIDNSGNMSAFYNGGSEGTGQNSSMESQNGLGEIYIGQSQSNITIEGLYGDIAEIVMYSRSVTTSERQQVEAYLNSKYQIY